MTLYNELQGRHVFITGGASGIGAGLVEGFLRQGCRVSMIDLDQDSYRKLIRSLQERVVPPPHPSIDEALFFSRLDISDTSKLQEAIKEAVNKFGPINILINNAANDERHHLETTDQETWDRLMGINLRPHFFTIQSVATEMKKLKSGVILNLSSNSYLLGLTGYPAYVTAKAGIIGLTKTVARELGSFGIRVNAIVPGWVMTPKQKSIWVTEESLKECLDQQSIKETVEVKDVVATALFLASDGARMITGQSVVVDGGRA